jgi:hypothetical protein
LVTPFSVSSLSFLLCLFRKFKQNSNAFLVCLCFYFSFSPSVHLVSIQISFF